MAGTPLLLDVDTGVDDAMAIALATSLNNHDLIAVTTVAGNVPLDLTTANTIRVLDWLGSDVPVYRGMSGPLSRPLVSAGHVHGNDGLGGWGLPDAARGVEDSSAPEAIVKLAQQHSGDLVLAFVGPLTNLAVALNLEPELPELVSRLVIMGGAFFNPGNVTEHAEFNIYVDPEAAAQIAASRFNATWIGLDVTHQTSLSAERWKRLDSANSAPGVLIREVSRQSFESRGVAQVHLHDPLAIATVEHPDIINGTRGEITVDVGQEYRGRTRQSARIPGRSVAATDVDVDRFQSMLESVIAD